MNNVLVHHGILGQKWGVRRYQNADGSYTSIGKKEHAADMRNIGKTKYTNKNGELNRKGNKKFSKYISAKEQLKNDNEAITKNVEESLEMYKRKTGKSYTSSGSDRLYEKDGEYKAHMLAQETLLRNFFSSQKTVSQLYDSYSDKERKFVDEYLKNKS